MPPKPHFEASPDVNKCCEYLRSRQGTALISYSAISHTIGRDVKGRDRYVLESARRKLEREGIVFVVETGRGIVRANDAQIATLSTDHPIIKTKRAVKRAKKRQHVVNVQNLSDEERAAFYIGRAILGAIGQATRAAFRNAVKTAANTEDGPIAIGKTLDLFNKMRFNGSVE